MKNLIIDFDKLIEDSLLKLAVENGWELGEFSSNVLFKKTGFGDDDMQISFDKHTIRIWTLIARKGEQFTISYKEMEEDKRLNAFVHVMIKSYDPSND